MVGHWKVIIRHWTSFVILPLEVHVHYIRHTILSSAGRDSKLFYFVLSRRSFGVSFSIYQAHAHNMSNGVRPQRQYGLESSDPAGVGNSTARRVREDYELAQMKLTDQQFSMSKFSIPRGLWRCPVSTDQASQSDIQTRW